jgi:uncharacterized protein
MRYWLLGLLWLCQSAWAVTLEGIPNPRLANGSYVADPDGIIGNESAEIERLLADLERRTGAQVAVVAVNAIEPPDVFDFAQRLFVNWGIGDRQRDDGLLVLLVKDQRTIRLHTGYGLEGVLPDVVCKRIQETHMTPAFKQGQFGKGILAGLQQVDRLISGEPVQPSQTIADDKSFHYILMVFVDFCTLFLVVAPLISGESSSTSRLTTNNPRKSVLPSWKQLVSIYLLMPPLLIEAIYLAEPMAVWWWYLAMLYVFFLSVPLSRLWRLQQAVAGLSAKRRFAAIMQLYGDEDAHWLKTALAFPVPFLLYYPYHLTRKQYFRNHPRDCLKCNAPLRKLSEQEEDEHLSAAQQVEESIKSLDYDVWLCDACQAIECEAYPGASTQYEHCPKCKAQAYFLEANRVLNRATHTSCGKGEEVRGCKNCGYSKTKPYSIPKLGVSSVSDSSLLPSSTDSSGSSSSSSGSDWGGGDSGGGGANSSW